MKCRPTGWPKRASFSMPSNRERAQESPGWRLVWLVAVTLLPLATTACKSIHAVQVPVRAGEVVSPATASDAVAEGRRLYAMQPRNLARVTQAAQSLEQGARVLREDAAANGEAARAWCFVAENETQPAQRIAAAKRAIVLARQARDLRPDDVAGHYWYAISVGLLADADRLYGLNAVAEMEPALQRAIALDERFDDAGPARVLGLLLLRTPGPPVSIGSARKGLRLLQRAVELVPEYPENHLYLAEAYHATGKIDEARAALHKVLTAPPVVDREAEQAEWRKIALRYEADWFKP